MKKIFFWAFHIIWRIYDRFCKKNDYTWAFCTHYIDTGNFVENQRAIFEKIKKNKNIEKIIFYRGESINFKIDNAVNYKIIKYGTVKSFLLLSKCKVIFITNTIAMEYSIRWNNGDFTIVKPSLKNRIVINMGHGIALKRILAASNYSVSKHVDRKNYRKNERKNYTGLIACSEIDRCVVSSMYYPASFSQTWLTGMPRSDFLLMDEKSLPNYIVDDINYIEKKTKGKRIISYMPTYRQTKIIDNAYYYEFSTIEIEKLKNILIKNNAVLAYRPHYFNNDLNSFNLSKYIDDDLILDFSNIEIKDVTAIIRKSNIIITDYSSVALDAIYLDKPIIGFCYDERDYSDNQEGLFYNLNDIYKDHLQKKFSNVIKSIDSILSDNIIYKKHQIKNIFFKHSDIYNCDRVIKRVNSEIEKSNIVKAN